MQDNNNIFSGIPSLGDSQGLTNFVDNQAIQDLGTPNTPAALEPNPAATQITQDPTAAGNPEPQPQVTPLAQGGAQPTGGYTSEQIAQIVAENRYYQQQLAASQNQVRQVQPNQGYQQPQSQPTYTAQQAAIIKQLIDRGVPLDRINEALRGGNTNNGNPELVQRMSSIENYIRNQEYVAEQNAFIDKMTTFGDKFGLTENDLVTFADKALSMGINVAQTTDVEAVFRAVYPEQYAIRMQRINNVPSSQIYGGSSIPEAPRATVSKVEDAYVENFLKGTMPNQYNQYNK